MTGQTIKCHQANPIVHRITRFGTAPGEQILFQSGDLSQGGRVIKGEQFLWKFFGSSKVDRLQSLGNFGPGRRPETAPRENGAQGVHITTEGDATEQGGFNCGGPAAHEWVVDDIAGASQALDEKAGQLWFKAGAVGNLVERVGLALFRGPEFVNEGGNC